MGHSISFHQNFAHDSLRIGVRVAQVALRIPKKVSLKLLVWLPRNALLKTLLFCSFAMHYNLDIFVVLKNGLHHFKAEKISFYSVYIKT